MDFIKNLLVKTTSMRTLILSSLLLVVVIIFALVFLVAHLQDEVVMGASGRVDVDSRVFYLDNEFFTDNPIGHHLHFLMSFTDYIEVDSGFTVRLDEAAEVFYSYNAVQHFVIRYMGTMNGVGNPVVFEALTPLSSAQGSIFADEFSFPAANSNGPGGTYTIFPKNYTDLYLDFVATQRQLMYQENVIADGLRGFSAELLVDFTYSISIPEWGIVETAIEGYRLSLSTEVFTLATTGNSRSIFNSSVVLSDPPPQITLPMIIIFVAAAALGIYGFTRGIRNLFADPNEHRRDALAILKKYSNEIVVSDVAPSLSQYQSMPVDDFSDLLRLAINLNKHIMCYHNSSMAQFVVIVEESAYYYKISYNGGVEITYGTEKDTVTEAVETVEVDD